MRKMKRDSRSRSSFVVDKKLSLGELGRQEKTINNCFLEAETAQSKEQKERVYRATRGDYATVEGKARRAQREECSGTKKTSPR